jgi:hypothetical protein
MISSKNLAGTIVQRGGLEKATLVPKPGLQRWRSDHAGRTLFRDRHTIFSRDARYRALVRRISAA